MAQAVRKKTAGRKNTKAGKKIQKQWTPVSLEIAGLIIIAISVFLIISIYSESAAGRLGELTKFGFVGLFGIGAYIFPPAAVAVCLYVLFSQSKSLPPSKYASSIALLFTVMALASVLSETTVQEFENLSEYLMFYFKGASFANGGLFGAVLGNTLVGICGGVVTIIILICAAIICFISLTGKSFFRTMSRIGWFFRDFFAEKDYADNYEEPVAPKKRERKAAAPPAEPPAPKRSAAAAQDSSSYMFEITKPAPKDKKIILVSEELAKKTKEHSGEPLIKTGETAYEEALRKKMEEQEKYIEESDESRPSVKLKVSAKKGKESSRTAEAKKTDEAENERLEMFLTKSAPTPSGDKNGADKSGEDSKSGEAEYGEDILFNSAPAYEDAPNPEDEDNLSDTPMPEAKQAVIEYKYPTLELLDINPNDTSLTSKAMILENSKKLEEALKSFKVEAKVMEVNVGPTVTRYELSPGVGVKVSSISNLADDLALNLAAAGIRIEAPIPGKAAVGIEVPNKEAQPVYLREVVSDGKFRTFPSKLAFALGKDIAGNVVIADIAKMPHMLIAGSTGSGKSVCINTLVTSIIYKSTPDEVKLLMIDPKVVELKVYNGIPHLLIPVVTDPKKAAGALNWAVREMTARYDLFAETSVRDLKGFNLLRAENGEELIPQIVIIIDELADLMMTAGKEVEEYICRLAQMARAAGIHLIIATQRPSVDVITGLIKANIPSKIAFAVSSSIDSRTILGEGGAEKLLGRGDMLFYPTGMGKPLRVQGSFISDKEVEAVVNFVKRGATVNYDEEVIEDITSAAAKSSSAAAAGEEDDEFMDAAIEFVVKKEKASASMLQRQFRIG
ncbi:MAG: DNA translocase FtsK, partial [Clostridiales bacterium]|nr:DNA translocase FtsK [Clostridiales bacterium]